MHEESKRMDITLIKDPEALRLLTFRDTEGGLSVEEIKHIFRLCNAVWFHSGDMRQPHVEIRAGWCSGGFIDTLRVLKYANLCQIMARDLKAKIIEIFPSGVDWIIGSDHAAATFSHSMAILYQAKHDFTEKSPDGRQLWKRFKIEPWEIAFNIEEIITFCTTLTLVRQGIREGNGGPVNFAPVIGTVAHRSDIYKFENAPIIYLVHYDIEAWKQEDCPLCKAGSKRMKAKENWEILTGQK